MYEDRFSPGDIAAKITIQHVSGLGAELEDGKPYELILRLGNGQRFRIKVTELTERRAGAARS